MIAPGCSGKTGLRVENGREDRLPDLSPGPGWRCFILSLPPGGKAADLLNILGHRGQMVLFLPRDQSFTLLVK
jgi:hypothetical protein